MEDNSGLKGILSSSYIYEAFQRLVGVKYARDWLAKNYWKLNGSEKVVDIGCGSGATLDNLPPGINYIGFDSSEAYIAAGRQRFDKRATFIVSTARQLLERPDPRLNDADLILCNGVLHHLDDEEVICVFKLAKQILTVTGRLVCFEPTHLAHQAFLSEWLMSKDRGRNVRLESEWKQLASSVFEVCHTSIATNLYRVPYVHIIIQCQKAVDLEKQA
ncbi:MAG TPA: class I SAM-dependent methyltransferase [Candidatus Udaeobacter sp.]|nr:class I SAM-dependent methyltransferase [Candidatus Udaeobacter sp.]